MLFFCLLAIPLSAQEKDATKLLYEAIYNEEVANDMKKAEELLNLILKDCTGHRPECARALYHLGLIAERKSGGQGSKKAESYYVQLIERYPDVGEYAGLARTRLAKLKDANTFTDPRDGHKYRWVKIGGQVWMAENLAFMPWVNPPKKQEYGIWVYDYEGEDVAEAKATENYQMYGCLYDWATAMALEPKYLEERWGGDTVEHQGICPPGWHLPTDGEWKVLEKALGMPDSVVERTDDTRAGETNVYAGNNYYLPPVGSYLKSASGWYQEGNGTNSSAMNVLPAGTRLKYSQYYPWKNFANLGYEAQFWTANDSIWDLNTIYFDIRPSAFHRRLDSRTVEVEREFWTDRAFGLSVRCVRNSSIKPEALTVNKLNDFLASHPKNILIQTPNRQSPINLKLIAKTKIAFNDNKQQIPTSQQNNLRYKKLFWRRALICVDDKLVFVAANTSGTITAHDINTLDTVWSLNTDAEINASEFLVQDNLIIFHNTKELMCLDKRTGEMLWKRAGRFSIYPASITSDAFFTSAGDTIFSINIHNGKDNWTHREVDKGFGKLLFADGILVCAMFHSKDILTIRTVFETVYIEKPGLLALNAETGDIIWQFKSFYNLWHCAYSNGLVFIKSSDAVTNSNIFAVNIRTGKKVWSTYLGGSMSVEPLTVKEGRLYGFAAVKTNMMVCVKEDGDLLWKAEIPSGFGQGNRYPVYHDEKLFSICFTNIEKTSVSLFALDARSGSEISFFDLEAEPITYPEFRGNRMYIGCTDGLHVYEYPVKN